MKPSGPGLLFVGNFLITASISLDVICHSHSLILPDLVLEECMILGIDPFCSGCPVVGIYSGTLVLVINSLWN